MGDSVRFTTRTKTRVGISAHAILKTTCFSMSRLVLIYVNIGLFSTTELVEFGVSLGVLCIRMQLQGMGLESHIKSMEFWCGIYKAIDSPPTTASFCSTVRSRFLSINIRVFHHGLVRNQPTWVPRLPSVIGC